MIYNHPTVWRFRHARFHDLIHKHRFTQVVDIKSEIADAIGRKEYFLFVG